MKQKRIHLASESGGRSRCRYTSRPSVRAVFLPLAAFLALPVYVRCIECDRRAKTEPRTVRVFNLEPGEKVSCYFCEQATPGRAPTYAFGQAFLAGADHPPFDGNANHICRSHLAKDVELPDPN